MTTETRKAPTSKPERSEQGSVEESGGCNRCLHTKLKLSCGICFAEGRCAPSRVDPKFYGGLSRVSRFGRPKYRFPHQYWICVEATASSEVQKPRHKGRRDDFVYS